MGSVKASPAAGAQHSQRRRHVNVVRCAVTISGVLGLLCWNYDFDRHHVKQIEVDDTNPAPSDTFNWHQITPSTSIEYHDCFDSFQCARLEVPMNYNRVNGRGSRVAIALARLPAQVPVTDPRYGGAVLINPGGPGGSGVFQALAIARDLQTIIDAEGPPKTTDNDTIHAKYFDMIGFDPRGVNNTTPGFSCFPTVSAQKAWELQTEAEGTLGSSDTSFMRSWQRSMALNPGCSESLLTPAEGEDEALGQNMNTPPVARDMLEITERQAEWREKQGQAQQILHDRTHGHDPEQRIAARTRWARGQEPLLYWGRSYGTVLGATFATMFPDRIARVVLDGVVDIEKYYSGVGPNAIRDADTIFDRFEQYCDLAGPDACPLCAQNGSTSIKEAFLALEASIYNSSIPVVASSTHGPEVITWTDVRTMLRTALYQPLLMFPLLAQSLGELQRGNGAAMVNFKQSRRSLSCTNSQCQNIGPWSPACQDQSENEPYALSAIMAADAEYLTDLDQSKFMESWAELKRDSEMIGDYWATLRLGCAGWKSQSKWKIPGPFMANTSQPLLFVSNALDPVTPLGGAQKVSHGFPGSVVLQQDCEGHTSASAPSLCSAKAIRKYFQTGTLPEVGTICNADLKPFLGKPGMMTQDMSKGDRALMQAMMNQVSRIRRAPL